MTLPLSKEQIEAIQARVAFPALCQQALLAIELERECTTLRARDAGWSLQCEELEAELTAARKALEKIRNACLTADFVTDDEFEKEVFAISSAALPSPQVKG
jgi:hypothetical protein